MLIFIYLVELMESLCQKQKYDFKSWTLISGSTLLCIRELTVIFICIKDTSVKTYYFLGRYSI